MVLRITPHHENEIPLVPQRTRGLELFERAVGPRRKFGQDNHNRHHLLFEGSLFSDDPILSQFREHPLCVALVERDWHVLIHKRFDRSPVPERDVVLSFLDEATLVQGWVSNMALMRLLRAKNPAPRIVEKIDELDVKVQEGAKRVSSIEVMPIDMREMVVRGLLKMSIDPAPMLRSFDVPR